MTEPQLLEPVDENWERALAVVAHPDDLEYGAASAVARWTSTGKTVAYLLLTRGQAGIDGMHPSEAGPLREEEERRSARAVGVETVEFLDYADGTIVYSLDLRRDIARAIRVHRPDVIISINPHATWGNQYLNMADHRVAGEATLDAARDAGNRWIFPELIERGSRAVVWSSRDLLQRLTASNPRSGCHRLPRPGRGIIAGAPGIHRGPRW